MQRLSRTRTRWTLHDESHKFILCVSSRTWWDVTIANLLLQCHMHNHLVYRRWSRSRKPPGWRQCRRCECKTCWSFNAVVKELRKSVGCNDCEHLSVSLRMWSNRPSLFYEVKVWCAQCARYLHLLRIITHSRVLHLLLIIQNLLSASPYDWITRRQNGIESMTNTKKLLSKV
jgi:hypothetical protein